jgi:hypothetical protein
MKRVESSVYEKIKQKQYWSATDEWDRIPGEVCSYMGNCSVYNVREFNVTGLEAEPYKIWLNNNQTKAMYGVP